MTSLPRAPRQQRNQLLFAAAAALAALHLLQQGQYFSHMQPLTGGCSSSSLANQSVGNSSEQAVAKFMDLFEYLCQVNTTTEGRICDLNLADNVSSLLGKVLPDIQLGPGLHYTSPLFPNKLLVPPPPNYRDEPLDCAGFAKRYQRTDPSHPVFEGNVTATPRVIVDAFLINNELDALEARMYELYHVVDYFAVAESAYSHRGVRKPRLLEQSLERFGPFLDKLVILDPDEECEPYMNFVGAKRSRFSDPKLCKQDDWDIQISLRDCVWPLLKKKIDRPESPLPDDAMIMFGDLDEIPAAPIVKHIRHCVPAGNKYNEPFWIRLSHRCIHRPTLDFQEIGTGHAGWNVWVQSISYPRQQGKLAFRDDEQHKSGSRRIPMLYGGFHLQNLGSLAHYVYRGITHAEGELSVDVHGVGGTEGAFAVENGFCGVTKEILINFQLGFQKQPEKFFWRFGMLSRSTITGTYPWIFCVASALLIFFFSILHFVPFLSQPTNPGNIASFRPLMSQLLMSSIYSAKLMSPG